MACRIVGPFPYSSVQKSSLNSQPGGKTTDIMNKEGQKDLSAVVRHNAATLNFGLHVTRIKKCTSTNIHVKQLS